jgi:hypothetical protein
VPLQGPRDLAAHVSALEWRPKENVTHVRDIETRHQAAPDVGQTRTDGSVRLLPGDLGQRLRTRFLEAEPWAERDRVVDQFTLSTSMRKSQDRRVGHSQSALSHHCHEISTAQPVGNVPANAQFDGLPLEPAPAVDRKLAHTVT